MQEKTRRLFQFLKGNQDIFIINLFILLKVIFFNVGVGLSWGSKGMVATSGALLLLFTSWLILFPFLLRTVFLLLFDAVLTVGMLADLLYYRFYHSVISVPVLFEAGLVKGVSNSILTLFSRWDLLLLLDFVLLIPYFIRSWHRPRQHLYFREKVLQVTAILLVSVLFLGFRTVSVAKAFDKEAYTGLNWNNTLLHNMGIIGYHLYDLYDYVALENGKVSLQSKQQVLQTWMENHRQSSRNLFGVAKGKNLIIIQMEALQGFVVGRSVNGQEITPNLNKLMKSSMYFDNFFTQIGQGNTSDAEFMALNSLYPAAAGSNYIMKAENSFQSLPWALKEAGYKETYAFHGNKPDFWNRAKMYPQEGFDKFYNLTNLTADEWVSMGLSDASLYRQATPILSGLAEPYFAFMVSLSGHYPYDVPADKQELDIPKGEYGQIFAAYLQAQHYADKALGEFMDNLKQQGILDNSVLVVYGDHFGTGWSNQDVEKFLHSGPMNEYSLKELNKVPLFIRLPGGQAAGERHITGGQMDLYPTLANLLGLDKNKLFYFGNDLLNSKDGFAAFRIQSPEGSFVTNDLFYIASPDGVFEHGAAYNRKTGEKVNLELCREGFRRARWELSMSDLIINSNGIPDLIPQIH